MNIYEQVKKKLRDCGINHNDSILIDSPVLMLDDERVSGISISQDKRWLCVPVIDEEAFFSFLKDPSSKANNSYMYRPQCFEIIKILETFINSGSMMIKTNIYLLSKE